MTDANGRAELMISLPVLDVLNTFTSALAYILIMFSHHTSARMKQMAARRQENLWFDWALCLKLSKTTRGFRRACPCVNRASTRSHPLARHARKHFYSRAHSQRHTRVLWHICRTQVWINGCRVGKRGGGRHSLWSAYRSVFPWQGHLLSTIYTLYCKYNPPSLVWMGGKKWENVWGFN